MKSFDEVVARFDRPKYHAGSRYAMAFCPIHADSTRSLQITNHDDHFGIYCHACKSERTKDILDAVGLTWADIDSRFTERKAQTWEDYVTRKVSEQEKKPCALVSRYDYCTIAGAYTFSRLRFKNQTGKTFRYAIFAPDKNGIEKAQLGLNGTPRNDIPDAVFSPNLEEFKRAVADRVPVFYAEGEKDCIRLHDMGFQSVTCGSADDWHDECAALFAGADVIIAADNDEPGQALARQVSAALKDIAARTRIITPCTDKKGADVSDYFDAGHTAEDLNVLIQAAPSDLPLDRFHKINAKGNLTGVNDFAIFQYLCEVENIRIIGRVPFVYRFGYYQADESGAILKTMIRKLIYPDFISSTTIDRIYRLFESAEELQSRPEEMNQYPPSWINFRNCFYDPETMKTIPHNAAFLATSQIPHTFDRGAIHDTQMIDSWLDFICNGSAENKKMLLQYCGYCMTRDTRQQKMLILDGEGGTGKSTLISLLEEAIGFQNASHISLNELTERFASYGLFGKLLNSCADLETTALDDTSRLKKILGEDSIRAESKGKDAISFKSFAKLIFSTNELPIVKGEKTNGFYRRLLILQMNRTPAAVDTQLSDKLKQEIDGFIAMCVNALEDMYLAGTITDTEESKAAVLALRKKSDTVTAFLADCTETDRNTYADRADVFIAYRNYCDDHERQAVTKNRFFESMEKKGFICTGENVTRMHGYPVIRGLKLKKDSSL